MMSDKNKDGTTARSGDDESKYAKQVEEEDEKGGTQIQRDNEEQQRQQGDPDEGEDEETWKDADFLSFDITENNEDEEDDVDDKNEGDSHHQQLQQSMVNPVILSYTLPPTSTLPPWMDAPHEPWYGEMRRGRFVPPLILLHNEIVNFTELMEPTQEELSERERLIELVKEVAYKAFGGKDQCEVSVFGSQATGLLLPTSDIDLVIHLKNHQTEESSPNGDASTTTTTVTDNPAKKQRSLEKLQEQAEMDAWDIMNPLSASASSSLTSPFSSPLHRFADTLRSTWFDDPENNEELSYLEVVENTRVPIVKFTHEPSHISVDVCFDQAIGVKAADLMKHYLKDMPPLRPLTFVLKYFLEARGLNEPYTGGVGSYMIQLMIVSFLQHRERDSFMRGKGYPNNLGALLLEFFELYGIDFNYFTTGISVRYDGSYFPKGAKDRREHFVIPNRLFSLALENPLEVTSDVGRATFRIQTVQRAFEVAMRVLLSHVAEPYVPTTSILASILPPTTEMMKRATLKKVLKIDNQVILSVLNDDVAIAALSGPLSAGRDKQRRRSDGNGGGGSYHRRRSYSDRSSTGSGMDISSDDGHEYDTGRRDRKYSKRHGRGSPGRRPSSGEGRDFNRGNRKRSRGY